MNRSAFTLIEVLLSIALLGLVTLALSKSVDILRASNKQLLGHLDKAKAEKKSMELLYRDIMSSDGNITIEKDDFTRMCLEETRNTLYALPSAKVCWVVHKDENTLLRTEGNNYSLPKRYEERIEVDKVLANMELFDIYHNEKSGKVLVISKQTGNEPVTFMVQGIFKPKNLLTDSNATQIETLPDQAVLKTP